MPYLDYDGPLFMIGSNGAKAKGPAWVDNILACPEVRVIVNRQERPLRGRLLEPGSVERIRVWAPAATKTPQYDIYQLKMTRPSPVVALEPRE